MVISILGCGWLGKALAIELIEEGMDVFGSGTREENLVELQKIGVKPFHIHFNPALHGNGHEAFFQSDVLMISIPPKRKSGGTGFFLQQMKEVVQQLKKGSTRKIVFISSTSVYPDNNGVVVEHDADPANDLVKAEDLLRNENAFETTILRFGGLVGPGRHPGKFFAGKENIAGGNNPVNIIHQYDCTEIIKRIIKHNVWNEVFNACADHHPSRSEFYGCMSLKLNLEKPQFINDNTAHKTVSSEKLKRKLPYHFRLNNPLDMDAF